MPFGRRHGASLSDWIEANVRLPQGLSAVPGPIRLYPYQREIAHAIGDPEIERVTVVKSVRIGLTTLLTSAIGNYVANEPSPILVVLPTLDDARNYVVSDIEPIFDASAPLRGLLATCASGTNETASGTGISDGLLLQRASYQPHNLSQTTSRPADEVAVLSVLFHCKEDIFPSAVPICPTPSTSTT